jgi:hypothetical protein
MGPIEIVVYKPVSELEIEVFVRGKGMLVPEIVIDHSPESLYLSIGLWSPHLSILVSNTKLDEKCLEAMKLVCFAGLDLVMRGKLESVI